MLSMRKIWALMLPVFVLIGCAQNDHFASDAVQYNKESEKAQDRVILLNVLRASYRRPLLFSGVQTVSGTASTQGQIGFSIPLAQNGGTTASTFSPQVTRSGGPTVTVGVIDTQEFYEGLLKPIPTQLIDLYVQRGLPPMLLFDLLFQKIEIVQDKKVLATFSNSVSHESQFDGFQSFLKFLVFDAKVTTEGGDKPKVFGPLLTREELAAQSSYPARAATAGLDIKDESWCDLSSPQQDDLLRHLNRTLDPTSRTDIDAKCSLLKKAKPASGEPGALNCSGTDMNSLDCIQKALDAALGRAKIPLVLYSVQKANTDYHLCFNSLTDNGEPYTCGSQKSKGRATASSGTSTTQLSLEGDAKNGPKICEAANNALTIWGKERAADKANDKGPAPSGLITCGQPAVAVSFVVRSTYGIIYYLGEIVRQQVRPDPWSSESYTVNTSVSPDTAVPIFQLHDISKSDSQQSFLDVKYDERSYAVFDGEDSETNEVLDLVAELTALNKSAKDLPASSVITTVGVQ